MNTEKPLLGSKYVPKYYGDYFDRLWLKKDLIEYFDYCEYSEMAKDPTKYFDQKKMINFDIIHHECRAHIKIIRLYITMILKNTQKTKKKTCWEVWLEILIEKIYL